MLGDILKEMIDCSLEIKGVSTDTRTMKKGELFIALKGENFDGHNFVKEAFEKGAPAAVVKNDFDLPSHREKLIRVDDPLKFLQRLAHLYRRKLSSKVIAITGSAGKTTTKEMLGVALSPFGKVHCAPKSYNNIIGLSLTLLNTPPSTDYIVLEIGTNKRGEVGELTELSLPDTGIITESGPAHLEGLKKISTVIEEKTDLFKKMKSEGKKYYNGDRIPLRRYLKKEGIPAIPFGFSKTSAVRCTNYEVTKEGIICQVEAGGNSISCKLRGFYHPGSIYSALCAFSVGAGEQLNLNKIAESISSLTPGGGRGMLRIFKENTIIYDDTYNANPISYENSLKGFENIKKLWELKRTFAVAGEMLELGRYSKKYHIMVMNKINSLNFDRIIFVGNNWLSLLKEPPEKYIWCENADEAGQKLLEEFKRDRKVPTGIFLKGSRKVGIDRVLRLLEENIC